MDWDSVAASMKVGKLFCRDYFKYVNSSFIIDIVGVIP
jgi:hypothetical protein